MIFRNPKLVDNCLLVALTNLVLTKKTSADFFLFLAWNATEMSFKVIVSQAESRHIIIERSAFSYKTIVFWNYRFILPTAIFLTAVGLEQQMLWLNLSYFFYSKYRKNFR